MNVILGCFNNTIKSLPTHLEALARPLPSLPHQSFLSVIHQNSVFGKLISTQTPEFQLPRLLKEQQCLFVAQGRIDNRQELIKYFNLPHSNAGSDDQIMLEAYLRWGKNCVHRLKGEWSLAAYDFLNQELFIARDPMGYTALYYRQDETGFYFSSSVKSLLSLPKYDKELNEIHFIRHLTLWDDDLDEHHTYFKNLFSLPPGNSLSFKNGEIRLDKYWNPANIPTRYYKNKQQYADEAYSIFSTAVERRLHGAPSVASMLSGGLDSSTVSYIAANFLKQRNESLTTLSHVPYYQAEPASNSRLLLDEKPNIDAIVQASGNMSPLFINSEKTSVLQGMIDGLNICQGPVHGASNLYWMLDLFKVSVQRGFSVLLTGEGGNGSISFAGADYLLDLNLKRALIHPRQFFRSQVIKPFNLFFLGEPSRKRKSIMGDLKQYVSHVFLRKEILEQYRIIEDIDTHNKKFTYPTFTINDRKQAFLSYYVPRSKFGAAVSESLGLELRDPTTDVDLMEYFFSIPNEAFFDIHYNNRMLVRRMMKGKLPDSILFDKRKGLQSSDIAYRIKAQQEEITYAISALQQNAAATHYIDIKSLAVTWQQYLNQAYIEPYQMQRLLKTLQFALFLQLNFD